MKHIKKMMALALAMVMMLAMAIPAMAAPAATTHSITITNTNDVISIDGKTYSAYKLFDSTHSGDAYAYYMSTTNQFYSADLVATEAPAAGTLAALLRTYFDFTAVSGDTTKVNVTPKASFDADAARTFADAIEPFLEDAAADKTGTASGQTCTITLDSGEAGQGYYIVTGTAKAADQTTTAGKEEVTSAVIITNEDPNPVVAPKAGIPTLDKKITGVAEGLTEVDGAVLDANGVAAVAKVGSTVSYEIDSIVPDLRGYTTYTFKIGDSITTGLDYVKSSFTLTINNTEVDIDPVFADGDKSFTLTIPMDTLDDYTAGQAIKLVYNCTVNNSSVSYDYDNNTANLEYSRNPYDDTQKDTTPDKKTYVININLDVDKVANSASGDKLSGAEFKLYRTVSSAAVTEAWIYDGTEYATEAEAQAAAEAAGADASAVTHREAAAASEGKEYYKWDNNKVTWVAEASAQVLTTNAQGKFTEQVQGLDKGTYYLVETKAPTGYNLLKDPIAITITPNEANNKVTYTATGASVTNGEVDLTAAQNANQPLATAQVINQSGTELPSTGGIGTTIFYVIGAILVLGAGILLVTRRRMNAN